MEKRPYYITTAIAYASATPHIGNVYEIVLADAIARYKRFMGYDVFFQTGTDEHLEEHIMASLEMAGEHEQEIGETIRRHLAIYKNKTEAMSQYFTKWLKEQF